MSQQAGSADTDTTAKIDTVPLLRDEVLSGDDYEDAFGHERLVDALELLLANVENEQSLVVGLFGTWGTGKSSIVQLLFDRINDPDQDRLNSVATVNVDAWAESGESIRNELLFSVTKELSEYVDDCEDGGLSISSSENSGQATWATRIRRRLSTHVGFIDPPTPSSGFLTVDEIVSQLYDTVEVEDSESASLWDYLTAPITVARNYPVMSLYFLGLLILVPVLDRIVSVELLSVMGAIGAIGGVLVVFFQKLEEVNTSSSIRQEAPRKDWTGFQEEIFQHQIDAVCEQENAAREIDHVVIAIDDLDRCDSDVVVDVLKAIKTFLKDEQNRCTYIIPCDRNMLSDHLKSVSDGSYFSRHEGRQNFLEKLFDVEFDVPEYESRDIKQYMRQQAATLYDNPDVSYGFEKIVDPDDVVEILSEAKTRTPRHAIQLLNQFQARVATAIEFEHSDSTDSASPGYILSEYRFLAWIVVIERSNREFLKKIRENPDLLEKVLIDLRKHHSLPASHRKEIDKELADFRGDTKLWEYLESMANDDLGIQDLGKLDVRPFVQLGQPGSALTVGAQFEQSVRSDYAVAEQMIQTLDPLLVMHEHRMRTFAAVLGTILEEETDIDLLVDSLRLSLRLVSKSETGYASIRDGFKSVTIKEDPGIISISEQMNGNELSRLYGRLDKHSQDVILASVEDAIYSEPNPTPELIDLWLSFISRPGTEASPWTLLADIAMKNGTSDVLLNIWNDDEYLLNHLTTDEDVTSLGNFFEQYVRSLDLSVEQDYYNCCAAFTAMEPFQQHSLIQELDRRGVFESLLQMMINSSAPMTSTLLSCLPLSRLDEYDSSSNTAELLVELVISLLEDGSRGDALTAIELTMTIYTESLPESLRFSMTDALKEFVQTSCSDPALLEETIRIATSNTLLQSDPDLLTTLQESLKTSETERRDELDRTIQNALEELNEQ